MKYKLYTIIRNIICPLFEIEKFVPSEGHIVDIGCGHGVFATILAIKSDKRYVTGIDISEDKISAANSAIGKRSNVVFKKEDILNGVSHLKNVDCFTALDVLCYIPLDKKKKLLRKCYELLPERGFLIIKTIYELPRWKYYLTIFHMSTVDKFMHRNLKGNLYFIKKEEYLNLLKEVGFKVTWIDIGKGYPYSHCLYICEK